LRFSRATGKIIKVSYQPDFQDLAALQGVRQRQLTNQALQEQNELLKKESEHRTREMERRNNSSRAKQNLFNYKEKSQKLHVLVESINTNPKTSYAAIKAAAKEFSRSGLNPDCFEELEYKQLSLDLKLYFEKTLEWAESVIPYDVKARIIQDEAEELRRTKSRQLLIEAENKEAELTREKKAKEMQFIILAWIILGIGVMALLGWIVSKG